MTSSEERKSKTKYRIIGSFSEYLHQGSIPVSWLLDGIFVDPRNSKPMEMDALSIYNICKLESTVKTQVFKHPLLNRIRQVGGFRFHNAWCLCETHCRFSAAGLKLLAETIDTDDNSENLYLKMALIVILNTLINFQRYGFLHDPRSR